MDQDINQLLAKLKGILIITQAQSIERQLQMWLFEISTLKLSSLSEISHQQKQAILAAWDKLSQIELEQTTSKITSSNYSISAKRITQSQQYVLKLQLKINPNKAAEFFLYSKTKLKFKMNKNQKELENHSSISVVIDSLILDNK